MHFKPVVHITNYQIVQRFNLDFKNLNLTAHQFGYFDSMSGCETMSWHSQIIGYSEWLYLLF